MSVSSCSALVSLKNWMKENPITTSLIVAALASSIFVIIGMVKSDSIQWESMHWTFYVGLWSLALSTVAIMICQCNHGGERRSYYAPGHPRMRRDPFRNFGPWGALMPDRPRHPSSKISYRDRG